MLVPVSVVAGVLVAISGVDVAVSSSNVSITIALRSFTLTVLVDVAVLPAWSVAV